MALLEGLDIARAEAVGATEKHRSVLSGIWGRLSGHFGPTFDVSKLTFGGVEAYVAARRAKGNRGQTIRRDVRALKRGLAAAKRHGLLGSVLDDWPAVRSDPAHEGQKGKLHPLPVLLAWLSELTDEARDEALFDLLTGLRAKELKRVAPSWIEPAPAGSSVAAILRVPAACAKNRRERTIGLTDRALAIAYRQMEKHAGTSFVFSQKNHRKTHAAACRRIKYAQVITLRDLRHTFATLGVQLTGDAVGTQGALGHSQLATTQRYQTATMERIAAASSAVDKALGGHVKGSRHRKMLQIGGRRGLRTHDIQLVRLEPALVQHLSSCNYCQAVVAQCAQIQADPGAKVHAEGSRETSAIEAVRR